MDKKMAKKKVIEVINYNIDKDVTNYLSNNDKLVEVGLNSISFIKIVVKLEEVFDIEFEDELLDYNEFLSLDKLCDYILEKINN